MLVGRKWQQPSSTTWRVQEQPERCLQGPARPIACIPKWWQPCVRWTSISHRPSRNVSRSNSRRAQPSSSRWAVATSAPSFRECGEMTGPSRIRKGSRWTGSVTFATTSGRGSGPPPCRRLGRISGWPRARVASQERSAAQGLDGAQAAAEDFLDPIQAWQLKLPIVSGASNVEQIVSFRSIVPCAPPHRHRPRPGPARRLAGGAGSHGRAQGS